MGGVGSLWSRVWGRGCGVVVMCGVCVWVFRLGEGASATRLFCDGAADHTTKTTTITTNTATTSISPFPYRLTLTHTSIQLSRSHPRPT